MLDFVPGKVKKLAPLLNWPSYIPSPFFEFCWLKHYFYFSASYHLYLNILFELLFLNPYISKNPEKSTLEGLGLLRCVLSLQNNSLIYLNYA